MAKTQKGEKNTVGLYRVKKEKCQLDRIRDQRRTNILLEI